MSAHYPQPDDKFEGFHSLDDEFTDDFQDEFLPAPPAPHQRTEPPSEGETGGASSSRLLKRSPDPSPDARPASKQPRTRRTPASPDPRAGSQKVRGNSSRGGKKPSPAARKSRPARPKGSNRKSKTKLPERSLPGVEGVRLKSRSPMRPPSPSRSRQPRWVRRLRKELPPYTDEILAFLLIAIGLLSFLTLLSPTSGAVGSVWSGALRQLFGIGAFAISAAILAAGALVLIPKLGIEARLNWWRVIAAEIFYFLLLAYIHAGIRASVGGEAGRVEAFARALEGRGGGIVGWAIQDALHMLLGDGVTGIVLLSLLVLSAIPALGIRRDSLTGLLARLEEHLLMVARRMEEMPVTEGAPAQAGGNGGRGTLTIEGMAGTGGGTDGNTPILVELPPIPGRPSIVTGETGAGAVTIRRPGPRPERTVPYRRLQGASTTQAERIRATRKIEFRFKLDEHTDRKRIPKRSDKLPPLDLLDVTDFERPSEEEININAVIIEETAEDFGMKVEVVGVKAGPTVTQYAVQPFTQVDKDGKKIIQRVRVTRVAALAKDLSLALAAPSVRIQAPVPGTKYIGVEVPNARPGIVSLRPIIESEQFYKLKSPLAIALGREVDGKPFAADLGKMPHLLIGGTTGSGKSVCLRSIATCLVTNNRPDQLRLIMIDPKMVELVRFNGLPHLLGHVEVQLDRIIGVLRWITREMDRRYRLMEEAQARNIATYNRGRRKSRLPYIVVLIDELAELMTEYPDQTEHLITRLAQMARATGIHLVVATQRPSTDVVTGLIKANFPARIAFAVASGVDSRVIIDTVGAEDLIGRGDMLFQGPDAAGPIRLQGCFVSDGEMERVVEFWRKTWKGDEGEQPAPWERALTRAAVLDETDEMLEEAIRVVQQEGEASASLLQRRLNVGYPRAGRIIDALYRMGVVGEELGGGRTRKVLIPPDVDPTTYIINWRMGN